jgi:hypothetical protein
MALPRETSKEGLRLLVEQFGQAGESSVIGRAQRAGGETLTGFLHAGMLPAQNEGLGYRGTRALRLRAAARLKFSA